MLSIPIRLRFCANSRFGEKLDLSPTASEIVLMINDDKFRANLRAAMERVGIDAANLSRKAGLNARAVTDILEGRSKHPRISTVVSLAGALGVTIYDLLDAPPRGKIIQGLEDYLSKCDEGVQKGILEALLSLRGDPQGQASTSQSERGQGRHKD